MTPQHVWTTPQKPADLAEKQLLTAILDGTFLTGSPLPAERDLAQSLGVTRPTLREALQRLSRDGWILIRQGKSTVVRDYWKEGNLIMLDALSRQPEILTPALITNLLEVRALLAPDYASLAVLNAANQLIDYLPAFTRLPDTPEAYAQSDHELHHELTVLSGNPVFTLVYNGFRQISSLAGLTYFASPEARAYSKDYYQGLLEDAREHDPARAAERTNRVMRQSLAFWQASLKD